MIRIGIDISGGDYAPKATVKGAILASNDMSDDIQLVLIGNEEDIIKICKEEKFNHNKFKIVHTKEKIDMNEYPSKAFSLKPNSSIVKGFQLVHNDELDGFASTGNTGAMLVGAMQIVKSIPGIIRPCIAAPFPKPGKFPTLLLDVGINPDCKPDVLYQYAILGSLYAEYIYNIQQPKAGLLNIGSEEEKGNLLTKATYQVMKGTKDFNFIGNIEGNEIFSNKVDVVVCDGFVGNALLKQVESFYYLYKSRKIKDSFFEKFNFVNYAGTPILGINAPIVIGHGVSNEHAIKNMIFRTRDVIKTNLINKIKEVIK